jgi:lysozyme
MLMLSPDSRTHLNSGLMLDEGFRGRKYRDEKGNETIGYGINLETESIPEPIAQAWMQDKVMQIEHELWNVFPGYADLCEQRKSVLINMAYNAGVVGLMEFRKMIAALQAKDYDTAANEIIDSTITPTRAHRLATIMRTGAWL